MPDLKTLLMLRECKNGKPSMEVYKDSREILTVGIGHKVVANDKLKFKDTIDQSRVDAFFSADTAKAVAAARSQAAQAKIKDSQFEVYLASVNFQLGTGWNTIHSKTWQLIVDGKYAEAAEEAGKSKWASQTPVRVKDFQEALMSLPAQSKKPGKPGADTGMSKGDMKRRLARSKRAPMNCAVGISADSRFGLLLMHVTRKPKALAADLLKAVPGAKNTRWGTAGVDPENDPKLVSFSLNRPLSNLERKLRQTLKGTGFSKVLISAPSDQ